MNVVKLDADGSSPDARASMKTIVKWVGGLLVVGSIAVGVAVGTRNNDADTTPTAAANRATVAMPVSPPSPGLDEVLTYKEYKFVVDAGPIDDRTATVGYCNAEGECVVGFDGALCPVYDPDAKFDQNYLESDEMAELPDSLCKEFSEEEVVAFASFSDGSFDFTTAVTRTNAISHYQSSQGVNYDNTIGAYITGVSELRQVSNPTVHSLIAIVTSAGDDDTYCFREVIFQSSIGSKIGNDVLNGRRYDRAQTASFSNCYAAAYSSDTTQHVVLMEQIANKGDNFGVETLFSFSGDFQLTLEIGGDTLASGTLSEEDLAIYKACKRQVVFDPFGWNVLVTGIRPKGSGGFVYYATIVNVEDKAHRTGSSIWTSDYPIKGSFAPAGSRNAGNVVIVRSDTYYHWQLDYEQPPHGRFVSDEPFDNLASDTLLESNQYDNHIVDVTWLPDSDAGVVVLRRDSAERHDLPAKVHNVDQDDIIALAMLEKTSPDNGGGSGDNGGGVGGEVYSTCAELESACTTSVDNNDVLTRAMPILCPRTCENEERYAYGKDNDATLNDGYPHFALRLTSCAEMAQDLEWVKDAQLTYNSDGVMFWQHFYKYACPETMPFEITTQVDQDAYFQGMLTCITAAANGDNTFCSDQKNVYLCPVACNSDLSIRYGFDDDAMLEVFTAEDPQIIFPDPFTSCDALGDCSIGSETSFQRDFLLKLACPVTCRHLVLEFF